MIDIKLLPPYESTFVIPFLEFLLKDQVAEIHAYVFNQEHHVLINVHEPIPSDVQSDLDFFIKEIQK